MLLLQQPTPLCFRRAAVAARASRRTPSACRPPPPPPVPNSRAGRAAVAGGASVAQRAAVRNVPRTVKATIAAKHSIAFHSRRSVCFLPLACVCFCACEGSLLFAVVLVHRLGHFVLDVINCTCTCVQINWIALCAGARCARSARVERSSDKNRAVLSFFFRFAFFFVCLCVYVGVCVIRIDLVRDLFISFKNYNTKSWPPLVRPISCVAVVREATSWRRPTSTE